MNKKNARKLADVVGGISFAFFIAWVYCMTTTQQIILGYDNYFWVIIFVAIATASLWMCIQAVSSPEKHVYVEEREIGKGGFLFLLWGVMQFLAGVGIFVVITYQGFSKDINALVSILAFLFCYRGLKFITTILFP